MNDVAYILCLSATTCLAAFLVGVELTPLTAIISGILTGLWGKLTLPKHNNKGKT
jgi:hypothetical protein